MPPPNVVSAFFRVAEVSEGQKKIPFALELDTGKWLHDSDKMIPYLVIPL